ncbi:hypothetical protein FKM82_003708 [Ascaphus truei]|uniref:diacylglycerol O-acyltransferase 1-like isoform X3 n=1 Tax=Ascaphus truei TaxID=8439 RepID=UPI003F596C6D
MQRRSYSRDCLTETGHFPQQERSPGRRKKSPQRKQRRVTYNTGTSAIPTPDKEQERWLHDAEKLTCHTFNVSLFSSDTGFGNYQGVFCWSLIILFLTHVLMNLENFTKYGLLVDPFQIVSYVRQDPYNWPATYLILVSHVIAAPAVFLEKFMTKSRNHEILGTVLQCIYLPSLIVFPALMVFRLKSITPVGSILTLLVYTILCLKLYSYHDVNRWYREKHPKNARGGLKRIARAEEEKRRRERGKDKMVMYPLNLTLPDLFYFLLAPTLCYELNFPSTRELRIKFLLCRLLEMVILFQLMLGIVQQWIVPVIKTTMKPICILNHFVWIFFFYFFFHSCLNFTGELLGFGDREFYLDWWNAESIPQFWSWWNRPAHKWLVRHVYKPLRLHGFEKLQAQVVVFTLSSLFYEYLISVPLKMFRFWIFFSMLAQIPLSWTIDRFFGGKYGNVFMWLSVMLGTPLIVLFYLHDYYVQHQFSNSRWGLF